MLFEPTLEQSKQENVIYNYRITILNMSDENPQINVDDDSLKDSAEHLDHVDTKSEQAEMKSILNCDNCGNKEEIPSEWEEMDTLPDPPNCSKCGTAMKVKLVHV